MSSLPENDHSKNPNAGSPQSGFSESDSPTASDADLEQLEKELEEAEASLIYTSTATDTSATNRSTAAYVKTATPPLMMVETAFLASTASLLWLVSYYLSIGPWMRILFPIPIALVYLRWGLRASWMAAITCGLLLSVLMGPYLSLLFFIPYGVLGVQLGALWKRRAPWLTSISIGTLISTLGFFMRLALLSVFLGEDLWGYLTNRITDLIEWFLSKLVDWGLLGLGALGQTNLAAVQLVTVGVVLCSDFVYLFTVHLAAWLLLERLGNSIPDPPRWVQVLMEEEK
jgi:uncharacterized protein YybS (DUF2232 family)